MEQQGNTPPTTTTATTSTVGRPCAQCQSRHLSCDRQRPCRRCVEAGPGLAMNCCDPTDAPRKRGRPPGACRKRRSATAPTSALATPAPPTVLYPAPKRVRAEPLGLAVPPPVPFAAAAAAPPRPQQASPADDPTGLWNGVPQQGSGQQSFSSPPVPQSAQQVGTTAPSGGGQPAEPDVMRAILHELREMRSAYTTLSAQVADLTKRQTTTDQHINALHHHHNHNQSPPHQQQQHHLQSHFDGASAAMTTYGYGSDGGSGPARRLSASWQELADLFNSVPVGSPSLPSPLPSPFPSSQGLLARMWSMSQPSTAPPPPPGYSSSLFSSLSSSSSIFSSSSSSSLSSSASSSSLSYPPSPPLPPTVPMHAFDRHHPRVLAVLPNNQMSSSFDRPWLIERMASDARLPKHQFPDPSLFQFFGAKRPLTVAANDQFRQLMRYSWGELHELNTAWFYPPSVMQVMAVWFRDWIGRRQPACLSPVFLTTCPLVTRDGQLLHSLARTQLYYDEQGDYSWSLTVLEYWRYVEHDSESEEAARQVSEELEVLLRDCHPSPCVDLPPSSSSPESTPSPTTFASPPTVSTDEYANLLKAVYAQGYHHP